MRPFTRILALIGMCAGCIHSGGGVVQEPVDVPTRSPIAPTQRREPASIRMLEGVEFNYAAYGDHTRFTVTAPEQVALIAIYVQNIGAAPVMKPLSRELPGKMWHFVVESPPCDIDLLILDFKVADGTIRSAAARPAH